MNNRPDVLIAGGGLAGLAAACELADAGLRVLLIEKRPVLGGRAYSHRDPRSGVEVDNGQHVFLGSCTEYIRFLKRVGAWQRAYLQPRLRVPVIDKVWGRSLLASSRLPPPLHLLPSLLRFRSLSPAEKAWAAYALAHVRSVDRRAGGLDDITFEEWLRERRQTRNAIAGLWNLIIQPTLNEHISRVSADLALMVFQEGFLKSREGANVGWARVGLSSFLPEAARRYVEERGGEVRAGLGLDAVEVEGGAVTRALAGGGELVADHYVLAVPHGKLLSLLPAAARTDPFFERTGRIGGSPIVNVHLWYDRPVWGEAFAAFLNTPVQWVFNKSKLWGLEGDGQYLDISLSGAHEFADIPGPELIELFKKEIQSLFPPARGAEVERALVVKEREATFAPRPGIARLRPAQRTPLANLYLAGDWTDTGWPATMESAVRSGILAAREVLRRSRAARREEVVPVS